MQQYSSHFRFLVLLGGGGSGSDELSSTILLFIIYNLLFILLYSTGDLCICRMCNVFFHRPSCVKLIRQYKNYYTAYDMHEICGSSPHCICFDTRMGSLNPPRSSYVLAAPQPMLLYVFS